jgi:hypothetical protein
MINEDIIEEILERDSTTKKLFLGCFAKDELPAQPRFPSCFVFNTDPRHKPGRHWVAVCF